MEINLKPEILTKKISKDKIDSFWYYDNDIAKIGFPNGKKLFLETHGVMRVMLEEDTIFLSNNQALEKAERLNFTDDDLNKLNLFDGWDNNNWFAVIMVDADGNSDGDDYGIAGDYDEAIELLKIVAKEQYEKMYS